MYRQQGAGRSYLTVVVGVLLSLAASVVRAELQIEISRGVDRATPIAIVPFGGGASLDVAAVVAADLARSGRFAPLDRRDMLQRPATAADVDFGDWRPLKVDALVVGRVMSAGADQLAVEFQVLDVLRGTTLLDYRQPATTGDLRRAAHRVADVIYEKLTGVKGIFSTRIAYVTVSRTPAGSSYGLIIADADGENPRKLLESRESILSPVWSPDAREIAYVSFESRRSEIYVQDIRSGVRKRVSARPGVNSAPAWSPDGRRLAR
jgi:TolB protein